jgi:hypothetical protein
LNVKNILVSKKDKISAAKILERNWIHWIF